MNRMEDITARERAHRPHRLTYKGETLGFKTARAAQAFVNRCADEGWPTPEPGGETPGNGFWQPMPPWAGSGVSLALQVCDGKRWCCL